MGVYICQEFKVESRCWLHLMYEKREHWVNCYLNGTFWAGLTAIGGSENMNEYFDGYVTQCYRVSWWRMIRENGRWFNPLCMMCYVCDTRSLVPACSVYTEEEEVKELSE